MTVILQDPVPVRDPAAGHAFPDPDAGTKARSILEHTLDRGNLAVSTPTETPAQATFQSRTGQDAATTRWSAPPLVRVVGMETSPGGPR